MKLLLPLFLILGIAAKAQDPCEFGTQVHDSIGQYKATKNYLMYERHFADESSYMYFSLALTDGLPTLNIQLIVKSKGFVKADCFDKNSRMFLQLDNGKIVSLLHIDQENCASSVRMDGVNNRVLSGYFLFPKEAIGMLEKSNVSLIRIRFSTGDTNYIIRETLTSELDGQTYAPSHYFVAALPCLEN